MVIVKPIEQERWHGKSSREFPSRPVKIEAFVDPETGRYATGLSEDDKKRLESITGFNLSDIYVLGKPHEFWSSPAGRVTLEDASNILNPNNPLEEIKIKLLQASHLVANSMDDLKAGKYPYAKFVIVDEDAEVQQRAAKSAVLKQVYILSDKLTPAKKADIALIVNGVVVKKQSTAYIEDAFDKAIAKAGPDRILDLMNMDSKKLAMQAIVLEALDKNVLRKEGSNIYYMDAHISYDVAGAVDYFLDKNNQAMKATILEQIN